jgi:hypothetical protein
VPQERLVPIALLRSDRCERDDPLLRTTGEDNRCHRTGASADVYGHVRESPKTSWNCAAGRSAGK